MSWHLTCFGSHIMKRLTALVFGSLFSSSLGCAIESADSTASTVPIATANVRDLDEAVVRYADDHNLLPNHVPVFDETGVFTTVSAHGFIDLDNAFFQDLGSNGRRCVSCHVPTVGWTITPSQLQQTFETTDGGAIADGLGLGAVFRTNDGANSPDADVSTLAKRREAYSMLLRRGVIRVGLPVPANAEFELVTVDDPYHFAGKSELSLFRRPLPTTNLKFDSTVMWDGRQVVPGQTVPQEFATQASDAVVGHAQGQPITMAQRQSIVAFETSLASAQIYDRHAKRLHDDGARGGADAILDETFYIGINDNLGDSQTGAAFNPIVFNIFDRWTHASGEAAEARRAVARGQALFNTKPIAISGVSGINDEAVFGRPTTLVGTCSTCHDTPNGGSHSIVAPLDLGLTDASRRTADMPLYTLRNKTTGEIKRVTDL